MPDTIKHTTGTKVAFGDVVHLSKERSRDPGADGFERYIGLEHLVSSDLEVRSWGDLADGVTFTNVFRPGQVLFGKRRAYQRKVAVADFSGVCSGDIYVLEPKGEQLLPELLPFICQSEPFYEYVISMSQGGLSPRVNWKALAKYEFTLPPLQEQLRIAEVLQAIQLTRSHYQDTLASLSRAEESLFRSLLSGNGIAGSDVLEHEIFGSLPREWRLSRMSEVADVAYGISAAVASNKDPSIGWPILTGANISLDGSLDTQKLVYHPEPTKRSFVLERGDVLLNWRSGSKAHVGKAALFDRQGDWTFASFILRLRAGDGLNNLYLWRLLNYMRKHELFGRSTTQQVNFKMNAAYFRDVEIPLPPREIQDRIVGLVQQFWDARTRIEGRINHTKQLGAALLRDMEEKA